MSSPDKFPATTSVSSQLISSHFLISSVTASGLSNSLFCSSSSFFFASACFADFSICLKLSDLSALAAASICFLISASHLVSAASIFLAYLSFIFFLSSSVFPSSSFSLASFKASTSSFFAISARFAFAFSNAAAACSVVTFDFLSLYSSKAFSSEDDFLTCFSIFFLSVSPNLLNSLSMSSGFLLSPFPSNVHLIIASYASRKSFASGDESSSLDSISDCKIAKLLLKSNSVFSSFVSSLPLSLSSSSSSVLPVILFSFSSSLSLKISSTFNFDCNSFKRLFSFGDKSFGFFFNKS